MAPDRAHTDDSLRLERVDADDALTLRRAAELAADKAIDQARNLADTALKYARGITDQKLNSGRLADGDTHTVALDNVRASEDAALGREYATADALLTAERQKTAMLDTLLREERARTDSYLLSERVRADKAITHRDDFLGMVTHDLRNHLHHIYLESAVGQARSMISAEDQKNIESMKRIHHHAKRIGRLVADLTDVARIEAGKLAVKPRSCDVSALLREAADNFAAMAGDKNISLSVTSNEERLIEHFDYERMLQVLSNFLSNAIKFTPAHGSVVIGSQCIGEELRLTVVDTGVGIPADQQEAVFERFWQGGNDDRRGLGLGLYIARSIVEGHGGSVRVESNVDKGSTFIATIPRLGRNTFPTLH